MKKTAAKFLVGGLMAAAVFGVTLGANSPVSAAAAPAAEPSMSQDQQQNSAMMQSSEMQKKCAEMMKNMDMKTMMDQSKMQEKMTQMTPDNPCCQDTMPGMNKNTTPSESAPKMHPAHHAT